MVNDLEPLRQRPVRPDEAGLADDLLTACGLMTLGDAAQFDRDGHYAFACDELGRVVGMAGVEVHRESGLLRSVAVLPAARRLGTGQLLTRGRIEWARRQGLRELYLLTTGAAGFFSRFGFEVIGRGAAPAAIAASHQWSSACPASSTSMRLVLQ